MCGTNCDPEKFGAQDPDTNLEWRVQAMFASVDKWEKDFWTEKMQD